MSLLEDELVAWARQLGCKDSASLTKASIAKLCRCVRELCSCVLAQLVVRCRLVEWHENLRSDA